MFKETERCYNQFFLSKLREKTELRLISEKIVSLKEAKTLIENGACTPDLNLLQELGLRV
jgi:hypothetical protein